MKTLPYFCLLSLVLLSSCTQPTIEVDSTSRENSVISLQQTHTWSDEWREINHENFWSNSWAIIWWNYIFPDIAFSYPENWEFECCGDTDAASFHLLYPKWETPWKNPSERNFFDVPKTFPSITITSRMWDKIMIWWSIDKPEYLNRDAYMNSFVLSDDIPTIAKDWKIKKVVWSDFIDYLVKTDDGLVTFRFNNNKLFEAWFEEKFIKLLVQSKPGTKMPDTIILSAWELSGYNPFITWPVEPPKNWWIANWGSRPSSEWAFYNNPMEFWKSERDYIESTQSWAKISISYEKGYNVFMMLSWSGTIWTQEWWWKTSTIMVSGDWLYKIGDNAWLDDINYVYIVLPKWIRVSSIQLKR